MTQSANPIANFQNMSESEKLVLKIQDAMPDAELEFEAVAKVRWAQFQAFLSVGFTEDQAIELMKIKGLTQC